MRSPGTPTTRFTRRVPSTGEKSTTMSPRCGSPHLKSATVVNGIFKSYASLFTTTRSPSSMVGFMEPVGTSFQSASADRNELTTSSIARKTRISFRTFFFLLPNAETRGISLSLHYTPGNVPTQRGPRAEDARPLVSFSPDDRNRRGRAGQIAADRGGERSAPAVL